MLIHTGEEPHAMSIHVGDESHIHDIVHVSKKGDKDQEWIQSSTIPDPGYQWESDNVTTRHHKREPSDHPFPSR